MFSVSLKAEQMLICVCVADRGWNLVLNLWHLNEIISFVIKPFWQNRLFIWRFKSGWKYGGCVTNCYQHLIFYDYFFPMGLAIIVKNSNWSIFFAVFFFCDKSFIDYNRS